jgi:hypothetical protein
MEGAGPVLSVMLWRQEDVSGKQKKGKEGREPTDLAGEGRSSAFFFVSSASYA